MCLSDSKLYVVGSDGGFIDCNNEKISKIAHPQCGHLYSVHYSESFIYACGADGAILKFRNSICDKIDLNCNLDFTSIWSTKENEIYASGGKGDLGKLIEVATGAVHDLQSRFGQIQGVSSSEIYGVDWDLNAWIWNGKMASSIYFENNLPVYCLNRMGNTIAFGCQNAIVIRENNKFSIMPIILDFAILQDGQI